VPLDLVQQHQVIDLTDDTPVLPSSCLAVEAQGNDFKAEPVQASKQWHLTVSSQLRDHLLLKLYKTVLPTIDTQLSPNLFDPRIQKLISYLRQIEKDFFIMADSRNKYYQMLAEKIFVIQKELKEKRKQLATANADLMVK
jgi:E1A/CREB-binding protein